jgi:hypothetical protein
MSALFNCECLNTTLAYSKALDMFTYGELLVFLTGFHLFRLSRLKWYVTALCTRSGSRNDCGSRDRLPFVLFGWGLKPPSSDKSEKLN